MMTASEKKKKFYFTITIIYIIEITKFVLFNIFRQDTHSNSEEILVKKYLHCPHAYGVANYQPIVEIIFQKNN